MMHDDSPHNYSHPLFTIHPDCECALKSSGYRIHGKMSNGVKFDCLLTLIGTMFTVSYAQ